MNDFKKKNEVKKIDTQEFELPDTHFVRDVENNVFQGIALQCLSKIEGIGLIEGNFIDTIFNRSPLEHIKGIHVEQDNKNHSVGLKIDVNICYGFSIPEKAEEIQTLCTEEITALTGLHVSYIHVVFKNVVLSDQLKKIQGASLTHPNSLRSKEEYNDEF